METTAFQGVEIKWAGPEPGTLKSTGRVSSKTFLCGNFFRKKECFSKSLSSYRQIIKWTMFAAVFLCLAAVNVSNVAVQAIVVAVLLLLLLLLLFQLLKQKL